MNTSACYAELIRNQAHGGLQTPLDWWKTNNSSQQRSESEINGCKTLVSYLKK